MDIVVSLRPAVNDPQGLVVRDGLRHLGFESVTGVRVGKRIEVRLAAETAEAAREETVRMCEQLLHNPVIEEYRIAEVRAGGD